MSKTITHFFKTLKQAADYQNRLYKQYPSVELKDAPLFTEQGYYTFRVII